MSPRSLPIPGSLLGEKKGKKKQALSKVATKGSSYGRGAGQRMAPCLSPFPIRPGWRQLAGKQDAAQEQPCAAPRCQAPGEGQGGRGNGRASSEK